MWKNYSRNRPTSPEASVGRGYLSSLKRLSYWFPKPQTTSHGTLSGSKTAATEPAALFFAENGSTQYRTLLSGTMSAALSVLETIAFGFFVSAFGQRTTPLLK